MELPHLALIWSPDRYLAAKSVVHRLCRLCRHSSHSGSRHPGLLPCKQQRSQGCLGMVEVHAAPAAAAGTHRQVCRKARRQECPPCELKCVSLGRLSSRSVSSAAWRTMSGVVYRRLAKAGSVTKASMRSWTAACTHVGWAVIQDPSSACEALGNDTLALAVRPHQPCAHLRLQL